MKKALKAFAFTYGMGLFIALLFTPIMVMVDNLLGRIMCSAYVVIFYILSFSSGVDAGKKAATAKKLGTGTPRAWHGYLAALIVSIPAIIGSLIVIIQPQYIIVARIPLLFYIGLFNPLSELLGDSMRYLYLPLSLIFPLVTGTGYLIAIKVAPAALEERKMQRKAQTSEK